MPDGTMHYPYAWAVLEGDRLVCPRCQHDLGLLAEQVAQMVALGSCGEPI